MPRALKPDFVAMIDRMRQLPGGDCLDGLVEALSTTDPSVAIRLNRDKRSTLAADLRAVPWAIEGYYVDGERPRFTFDPALHQGLYYVQDASSMVIGRIVKQLTAGSAPQVYIDACAAPGGKTTAAIDALPPGSLVIANEFDSKRIVALSDNLMRRGYEATVITRGDTSRLGQLRSFADIIAVDAPCSGEGMMRKDEDAVAQWSRELVEKCAALQREILLNMWPALRPGGFLIYSTCTFNRRENEDNLRFLVDELGAEAIDIDLPTDCGIAGAIDSPYPAARFIPGRIDGEGLFIAVVRKPGNEDISPRRPSSVELSQLKWDGTITPAPNAFPKAWKPQLAQLRRRADVVSAGIVTAEPRGRDLIPTQAAALADRLTIVEKGPAIEVPYSTAISYLRREAITLPENAPRGLTLLSYAGHPLGFAKNLGNRANNLYPQGLAIKSTHLPTTFPPLVK